MLRLIILTLSLACSLGVHADKKILTVSSYPAVYAIVKAAFLAWLQKHLDVEVKVVGAEYAYHHTAMTTVLATYSTPVPYTLLRTSATQADRI